MSANWVGNHWNPLQYHFLGYPFTLTAWAGAQSGHSSWPAKAVSVCPSTWSTPAPAIPQRWLQCRMSSDPTNLHPIQPPARIELASHVPGHPKPAPPPDLAIVPSNPNTVYPGTPGPRPLQFQPSHQSGPSMACPRTPRPAPALAPAIPQGYSQHTVL